MISIFTLYLSLLVLLLKTICDIKYNHVLFGTASKHSIYLSYFSLICFVIVICQLAMYGQDNPIVKTVFVVALFVESLKYRYKLFNSIEEIYEFVLIVGLAFATFSPIAALLIFSIVLASSISAGYSKIRSKLWSGKNSQGFIMFATLPSVSRRIVATISSNIGRSKVGKKIFNSITLVTPYVQIFSAAGLIIMKPGSLFFNLSCYLQLAFAISLFLISDLSWITSLYALLIMSFVDIKMSFDSSALIQLNWLQNFILLASIFYVTLAWLIILFPHLYLPFRRNKLFFGLGPFKMFTEAHMCNIITYHHSIRSASTRSLNAFDQNGHRSLKQNFNSRHLQALMYPIGDLVQKIYEKNSALNLESISRLEEHSKSGIHLDQLINFASSTLDETVSVFQHCFDRNSASFNTRKIAEIRFSLKNQVYCVSHIFYDDVYPFQGR